MKYARPSFSPAANSVQPLKADRYCSSDVANRPEVFPASATTPPGRTARTISGIRSACQYIQQTIRSQAAGSIRNSWRSRSARTQRTPGIGALAMSTAVTVQPRLASQVECRPEPQARSSAKPAGTPVRQRVNHVSGWLFVASIFSLASLSAAQTTTTIHDVSIIDVATAQITPHQDIVIRGERIAAIRPAARRSRITRYVIPGLWDMHVHLSFARSQFPLFLANGVTGVRDMGTDLRRIRTWQSEIAKGEVAGPRIYACGSSVSSTPSGDPNIPVNVVRTPKDAREAFDRYYDERVDFIKVLNLSPAAFEALAEASRHNGIPFAGDLPPGVSAFTAAQDRMVSMEHLFGVGLACSRRENELRNEALSGKPVTAEMMKSYDPEAAAALWDLFRRYDVRQCPTLAFWSRMTGGVRAGGSEPGLRYIEASIRKKWTDPGIVRENPDLAREEYAFALRLTRDMAKAGVPILAGTDTGTPWTVPGIELHRELALLVKAGLSPAQALRSATSEPARLMRREKEIGYVRKGYAADLVVLTANPLIDIDNTRRIDAVVVRGRQMNRLQLNQMLQRAAAQASKT